MTFDAIFFVFVSIFSSNSGKTPALSFSKIYFLPPVRPLLTDSLESQRTLRKIFFLLSVERTESKNLQPFGKTPNNISDIIRQ